MAQTMPEQQSPDSLVCELRDKVNPDRIVIFRYRQVAEGIIGPEQLDALEAAGLKVVSRKRLIIRQLQLALALKQLRLYEPDFSFSPCSSLPCLPEGPVQSTLPEFDFNTDGSAHAPSLPEDPATEKH